jgi:NAD(P)-dependent dehydrogenase (short-subunit alcohol dehydrogenase family)
MSLAAKRVLITGSTTGIGYAAAQAFLQAGARVAVHGRDSGRVQQAIDMLGFRSTTVGVVGDVGEVAVCRRIVEEAAAQLGGLDCLVSNAGIADLGYPEDVAEEHWDKLFHVNCRSGYFLTKCALPDLKRSKGTIVLVASAAGICAGPTDGYVYAITKAGLISLAQSLAVEFAPYGVRINALCPGYIDTPLIAAENAATGGQIHRFVAQCTPLRRIGTVTECASTILHLASDGAAYFTGSTVVNDGGLMAVRSWGGRN